MTSEVNHLFVEPPSVYLTFEIDIKSASQACLDVKLDESQRKHVSRQLQDGKMTAFIILFRH